MNSPFFTGTPTPGNTTRVHGFPLPPDDGRFSPHMSRGQYVLPHPITGRPNSTFTRATTTAHVLENQTGLDKWKMSNVVLGLKTNPKLLDAVDLWGEPLDVKRSVRECAEKASEVAGANESSECGTAIHAWTEALELGHITMADIPIEFRATVEVYLARLNAAGISTAPGMIERIVFNPTTEGVGTLDRIYQLADGSYAVGDLKTSKNLSYSWVGFAAQLATYATASHMLSLDGSRWEPMPEVRQDFAILVHLPSDQPGHAQILTYDLEVGREALALALEVQTLHRTAGERVPNVHPLPQPDTILEKIKQTTTPDELSELWNQHQILWNDAYTQAGLEHLRALGYQVYNGAL